MLYLSVQSNIILIIAATICKVRYVKKCKVEWTFAVRKNTCDITEVKMEKLVEELRKMVDFKETTEPGDIVLVAIDTPRSLVYARVRDITRDTSRRDEWWFLSLQLLTVPPQEVVWTLRSEQFTGQEIFSMGGDKRFIQAVDLDSGPSDSPVDNDRKGLRQGKGRPRLQVVK